jgi:hypothetical protein
MNQDGGGHCLPPTIIFQDQFLKLNESNHELQVTIKLNTRNTTRPE